MDCTECKERMYPADPAQPHYNYKYGWRIPSECEQCNMPLSGRTPVEKPSKTIIKKVLVPTSMKKQNKLVETVDLVDLVEMVERVDSVEKVENGRS